MPPSTVIVLAIIYLTSTTHPPATRRAPQTNSSFAKRITVSKLVVVVNGDKSLCSSPTNNGATRRHKERN